MQTLECQSCGYKLKSSSMPKRCPYCSKEGSVKSAKSAQDIIDESIKDSM